jgi:hypothetical protein
MSEGINIELAQELAKEREKDRNAVSIEAMLIEILEALLLALVAVGTAWSGYHAAKWNGQTALLYGSSAKLRMEAAVDATEGGQQRLLDVVTFNTWIEAAQQHDETLVALYIRRFSPEYRAAFYAWLKYDPLTNPDAPAGPTFMPEYHNHLLERSAQLNQEANTSFQQGTLARVISERYVFVTLLLAAILFLITLSQRFKVHRVRQGLLLVAGVVMAYTIVTLAMYPRI